MIFRASWILPIATRPIAGGWVAVEDGRISGCGTGAPAEAVDLGHVAVVPALVNAHTHLELSYLHGVVPPADRFLDWIRHIMAARRQYPDPRNPVIVDAARKAIDDAHAAGTGLVGDISNTLVTAPLLSGAGMPARVFHELIGFNVADPVELVRRARVAVDAAQPAAPDVTISVAAHAPYSVSPALFQAIRRDLDIHASDISTVHLAESPEECELTIRGTGPWKDLLAELDAWPDAWQPSRTSPVAYLSELGFLDSRVLAVHGVQCDAGDLARLRGLGTPLVSCPRSNRHVGVGDPPIEEFYAAGITVAFGTDSLASVDDLNMFAELAAARRLAPRIPARALLESATIRGAQALGFGATLGTIEAGKRAALIAVSLPRDAGDVEEYLLSGIAPGQVTWLDSVNPNPQ